MTTSATGNDPRTYDYSQPTLSCDIVMKGGITSGVVYPQAVCEIARTYRLRNVGGTSAGAIAAAAAAAAELGRGQGGFARYADLPNWIGADRNLQSLFQPQRSTRALFRLLIAGISRGWAKPFRILAALVVGFPIATIISLAPGALLLVFALLDGHGALRVIAIVCAIILLLLGFALGLIAAVAHRLTRRVPDNCFGICSGNSPPGAKPPALTPWLADELDKFARGSDATRSEPLTFGELWAGPPGATPPAAGDRWLNLEMMTTNLTNRRPERLPWAGSQFFFDPDQFADLFPPRVIEWLRDHPPADPESPSDLRDALLRRGLMAPLLPLPDPADLPVILATRMSLSFPVLLSALPLWTLDMSSKQNQQAFKEWRDYAREHEDWQEVLEDRDRARTLGLHEARPEICWFSDGGISSNFPIHFFDTPLPRWPTFGINLRGFHPDFPRDPADEANNIYMPKSNSDGILEWFYRFPNKAGPLAPLDGRIGAFLSAVVRTMQNRVDEAQLRMPGYRDRIAHVGTAPDEGGMNLNMPSDVLKRLNERGRLAGAKLNTRFATPGGDGTPLTWTNHRWVRYRSSFAALQGLLTQIGRGYEGVERPTDVSYADLIVRGPNDPPNSYRSDSAAQQKFAAEATDRIIAVEQWLAANEQTFADGAPRPAPEARIAPPS